MLMLSLSFFNKPGAILIVSMNNCCCMDIVSSSLRNELLWFLIEGVKADTRIDRPFIRDAAIQLIAAVASPHI